MFGAKAVTIDGFTWQLFAIMDVKTGCYMPPLVAQNTAEALRIFGDLLTDPQSRLSKHPADYRLYRIGEFHFDSGLIVPLDAGVQLVEEGLLLVKEA